MSTPFDSYLFIGIRGTVLALHRANGAPVWQTPLKGYAFVNVVLLGSDLLATTKGEVYCLDPATGRIRWNNPMRGLGYGLATIASSDGSSWAAMAEYQLQQEEASSSAPGIPHGG